MDEDKLEIMLPHYHLKCGGTMRKVRNHGRFVIVYYCDKCKREVNVIIGMSANDIKADKEQRQYRQNMWKWEQEQIALGKFERLLLLIKGVDNE